MFLFSIFVCWCSKLFLVSTLTVGHERVKRSGGLPNHITYANFIPTSTTYQEPQIGHVVVKYSRILPKWSWISSVESYNSTVKVYYLMMPWTLSFILHLYHWSFLSHSYPNNQEDPVVETLRLSPTGSCDGWFFVESRACPLIPKDRPPTLVVWFKGKTIKTYIWMLVNAFCFFLSRLQTFKSTGHRDFLSSFSSYRYHAMLELWLSFMRCSRSWQTRLMSARWLSEAYPADATLGVIMSFIPWTNI